MRARDPTVGYVPYLASPRVLLHTYGYGEQAEGSLSTVLFAVRSKKLNLELNLGADSRLTLQSAITVVTRRQAAKRRGSKYPSFSAYRTFREEGALKPVIDLLIDSPIKAL